MLRNLRELRFTGDVDVMKLGRDTHDRLVRKKYRALGRESRARPEAQGMCKTKEER
jgi:hypothetical protein